MTATESSTGSQRTRPIRTPKNIRELHTLVSRAITALRHIQRIEARRDARIAYWQQKIDDLKSATTKERDDRVDLIRRIMPHAYEYIEEHRFDLTNRAKRKSVGFPDGTFVWQNVRYTDIPDEDKFFEEVRRLDLASEFIREKQEPNRSALRDEANEEKAKKLTTAKIIQETRPQLATSGTTLKIERRENDKGELVWDVVDSRQR
ncbi:MAG: host-nuclease inhibitor Gam family protein [Bacillota bacterium]